MISIIKHAAGRRDYLIEKYRPVLMKAVQSTNTPQIEEFLIKLVDQVLAWNPKYSEWYLKQLLKFRLEKGQWLHYDDDFNDQTSELNDYLKHGNGSIPSFNTTFKEAFALSDAWHEKMRSKGGGVYKTNDVWANLSDGYKLVNVQAADLKEEGFLMGHCVGGYCEAVNVGDTIILSLRDQANAPHLTIELTPKKQKNNPNGPVHWSIDQVKGKQNKPQPQYAKWAEEAINFLLTKNKITFNDEGLSDYLDTMEYDHDKEIQFLEKIHGQPDISHTTPALGAYELGRYGASDEELMEWLNSSSGDDFKNNFVQNFDLTKYADWLIEKSDYARTDVADWIESNAESLFTENLDRYEDDENAEEVDIETQTTELAQRFVADMLKTNKIDWYDLGEGPQQELLDYFTDYWVQGSDTNEFLLDRYENKVEEAYIDEKKADHENYSTSDLYDRTKRYYQQQRYNEALAKKTKIVNDVIRNYNIVFPPILDRFEIDRLMGQFIGYTNFDTPPNLLAEEFRNKIERDAKGKEASEREAQQHEIKVKQWDQQLAQTIPNYSIVPQNDREWELRKFYNQSELIPYVVNYMTQWVNSQNPTNAPKIVANWLTRLEKKSMPQKEYKDGTRLKVIEFDLKLIDQYGDAVETYHFETKEEAMRHVQKYPLPDGEAVAIIIEMHTSFYPAFMFDTPDVYKTIFYTGDLTALKNGSWI